MNSKTGKVYLIGAGPGDPGLLTIKAKECIENADIVVYDYLASPFLLNYAKKNASIFYVGKKGSNHTLSQDKINLLLVEKAKNGNNIARLKGGDPYIFGRGAEEAQFLLANNIAYEVIPGITSAIAAPAYAGIPITHREHNSCVSFITGHENPEKKESSMQWELYAQSNATLVFLMGVKNLEHITYKLIEFKKDPKTPIALVRWGTTSKQQTITGTLDSIVETAKKAKFKSPAIIIIGNVVNLRDELAWFDKKPLFGKTIIITRARAQASSLVSKLSKLGAYCVEIPTIKIQETKDKSHIKKAIKNIKQYDWLIFTSVNGVKFFFKTLFAKGYDTRTLGNLKCACIGPVTKKRLLDYGIVSDILPDSYVAESVINAFSNFEIKNKKILLPRAKNARTILPKELTKIGAIVDEVIVYEAKPDISEKEKLISMLENNEIDIVTFTSSSTVSNFISLIKPKDCNRLMKNVVTASIGPITCDTAKSFGIKTDIQAKEYTIEGLVNSLIKYYDKNKSNK